MKCNHCLVDIELNDVNSKSFRLQSRWVHYHVYCFEQIIQEPKKHSAYKSINSSQCIRIDVADNFSK